MSPGTHALVAFALGAASVVGVAGSRAGRPVEESAEAPSGPTARRDRARAKKAAADESATRAPRTRRYAATFVNLHTDEVLGVPEGSTPSDAQISHFLRCRVTHDERLMQRRPVDVALSLARTHHVDRIMVVSGYRSPRFNELLRKKGHEVAANSRHTFGQALDFRLPGVSAVEMAAGAEAIHEGGIGTYPVSGFIHVDTGPDRRWRGN